MKSSNGQPGGPAGRSWRNFVIDRRFQWKYAGLIMATMFSVSLVCSMGLYAVLYNQARVQLLHPLEPSGYQTTTMLLAYALGSALLAAAALGVYSILVTHRICGPIFVIGRWLDDLADGRFPQRRPLRTKDEFREFSEKFWSAVESMRVARLTETRELQAAARLVRQAATQADGERARELESVAGRVEALCEDRAAALGELDDDAPQPETPSALPASLATSS